MKPTSVICWVALGKSLNSSKPISWSANKAARTCLCLAGLHWRVDGMGWKAFSSMYGT